MLKYKIPQIVTLILNPSGFYVDPFLRPLWMSIKEWGKENKIKKSLNARNSRICIINFDNLWSVWDSNSSPRHCQYSTDMITIVCFTRYCGISENIQRFVLVKYRVISVVYTSYVFKYFVDEKRTIVRTFQYPLFFRFPVHLGEQFCFLLVGGRNLLDGSREKPTPPAFAGRGEGTMVWSFPLTWAFGNYLIHICYISNWHQSLCSYMSIVLKKSSS